MNYISYKTFIDKIYETKKVDYDCSILLFFTGEIISNENLIIEDEIEFNLIFDDLIFYIETSACDDKNRFREVIDDLITVLNKRKIDDFDIKFILNKEKIFTIVNKVLNKKISNDIYNQQLIKIFKIEDLNYLRQKLKEKFQIN